MIQHELFLCVVHGAVRAFEHWNFLIDNMLVKVRVEQGLQCEHGITHRTLIDHPDREKTGKKNLRKTLVDTVKYKKLEEKKCQCLSDNKITNWESQSIFIWQGMRLKNLLFLQIRPLETCFFCFFVKLRHHNIKVIKARVTIFMLDQFFMKINLKKIT